MKKTSILLGLMATGLLSFGQAPVRMSLYEEFTGENCGPCASANPALNTLLDNNASKVIALKWEVPIPSAPSNTWSLYRTNEAEINWRYRSTNAGGYGYPAQYTPTSTAVSGINSAPTGLLDGKHCWQFGATSDHPANLNATVINSAQVQPTNFSIAMTTSWNPNYTNCVVDVTLTSSASFTAAGSLRFRLCLVEREINFPSPPGTTAEKDFKDVVRKSYPTSMSGTVVTGMGTSISNTWTAGMTQTLSINCAIPNYIVDYGQMAFVGFIQDDVAGLVNKPVYQAYRSAQPSIPNEAKAVAVLMPSLVCTSTIQPSASIKNNGANAITDMTITPYVDGVAGTPINWSGNLAVGVTTTIPMGVSTATNGAHTYSFNITGVSGGDIVLSNNGKSATFMTAISYAPAPLTEGFVTPSFPPANWAVFNPDGNPNTFVRSTLAGGFGNSSESMLFQVNSAPPGTRDNLILAPISFSGVTNPELSFDIAYNMVSQTSNDSLIIYVSTNCGSTWSRVYQDGKNTLATKSPTNVWFVPTAAQWAAKTVALTSYSNAPEVLVRFEVFAYWGNRMFIDNINIQQSQMVGMAQTPLNLGLDVYPNPARDYATISVHSSKSESVKVEILNALGQQVYTTARQVPAGSGSIELDCRDFAPGVYLINIEAAGTTSSRKLVINH